MWLSLLIIWNRANLPTVSRLRSEETNPKSHPLDLRDFIHQQLLLCGQEYSLFPFEDNNSYISFRFHMDTDHFFLFSSCTPSLLFYKRHNHIVELLRPISVKVSHLEPISLILDADVIQLNEYLGRFNVVATVPLERRAKR